MRSSASGGPALRVSDCIGAFLGCTGAYCRLLGFGRGDSGYVLTD